MGRELWQGVSLVGSQSSRELTANQPYWKGQQPRECGSPEDAPGQTEQVREGSGSRCDLRLDMKDKREIAEERTRAKTQGLGTQVWVPGQWSRGRRDWGLRLGCRDSGVGDPGMGDSGLGAGTVE